MMTGQQAYERDVAAHPTYPDGSPRPTWENLREIAKRSWNKDPTDRTSNRKNPMTISQQMQIIALAEALTRLRHANEPLERLATTIGLHGDFQINLHAGMRDRSVDIVEEIARIVREDGVCPR
jgi:hypothetical protein